ncbi:hypothetical protein ACM25N_15660 [Roseovarius sp. C7]|uniref:hypothetical protein n=1 Tax=Roseovarius sp. C7 TaxID=3398643 RepID=UPI0039F651E3
MNDRIKIAIIAAGTVTFCVGLVIYFSPYQSCVRAQVAFNEATSGDGFDRAESRHWAQMHCGK